MNLFVTLLILILKPSFIYADTCTWNTCPKWDQSKINVHFIPSTHDDLGYRKTVDDYYTGANRQIVNAGVRYIFNSLVSELARNSTRRFSYCETGFLKRWLDETTDENRQLMIKLVQTGQLELFGGGWVQPDEATTHYIDLIDQYTLGLRILNETFGECGHPKVNWQIDPFGHSREHANLIKLIGYDSLFFSREHYEEFNWAHANKTLEVIWHVSEENGNSIFTGDLYRGISPPGFCWDILCTDDPIVDNPQLEGYNLDQKINDFIQYINPMIPTLRHNHLFVLMGQDFHFQQADMWYSNMDKLIFHLNQRFTNITAFYSTVSCYKQALNEVKNVKWPEVSDDFFPYATSPNAYWTGFYTTKPSTKGLGRASSALLQHARQMSTLAQTSWSNTISEQIETLERAVGLVQHHDALTGTSTLAVTQDYNYRMTKGWNMGEQVLNSALNTISQNIKNNTNQQPPWIICRNINESECLFTKSNNTYIITVYNGNSQNLNTLVKVPLYQDITNVNLTDDKGTPVEYQIVPVFTNSGQLDNPNISTNEIWFLASAGPLGFQTYYVTLPSVAKRSTYERYSKNVDASTNSISNGLIQLDFDSQGRLSTFHDLKTGKNYPLTQEFAYYHGHNDRYNQQGSGAYVFRPENSTAYTFNTSIELSIINTTIVKEARQIISPWVSQIVRLIPNKNYVEFEWTIGPIPYKDNISKEVITRYTVNGLQTNGTFWTDSNGRQLMKRIRNYFPHFATYKNVEPIAGNYYPIDSRIIISNGTTTLAVLNDRSNGGSSINDGQMEIMLHRRTFYWDHIGPDEPLNETGRDDRGLVVRGKHWLILGDAAEVNKNHRTLAYEKYHEPLLLFSTYKSNDQYRNDFVTKFSGLQQPLPPNINLLTLKQLDNNNILIRLEHIYQKNEDTTLSQPASINLANLIPSFNVTSIQELSLAANNYLFTLTNTTITLNPMEIKTYQLTIQSNKNPSCGCPAGNWYQSTINPCDCYSIVQTPSNWISANNNCQGQNPKSTLASIASVFENNELLSVLQKTGCSQAFIGLEQQNNAWTWVNNDTSTYRNWRAGYPLSNNNYAQLNTNDGRWTNVDGTTTGCYICEVKN